MKLILLMLAVLICCGCPKPCPVCPDTRITLPVEQAPILREVPAVRRGDEFCLSDRGRKDVLINLELVRAWGEINFSTIEQFNKREGDGSVKKSR